MKNLAVAKKIMLGFGVAVFFIAIMLTITMVTSLSRGTELNTVNTMTDLQTEMNLMMDDVNAGRISIQAVYSSMGANAEYETAMRSIRSAQNRLDTLDGYAEKLQGSNTEASKTLTEDLARLRELFSEVITELELVYAYDVEGQQTIAVLLEAGGIMAETTTRVFQLGYDETLDLTEINPGSLHDFLPAMLLPAHEINTLVDSVRIMNRDLILSLDTSVVPEMIATLDAVLTKADEISLVATNAEDRAAMEELLTAEASYRKDILAVEQTLNASENSIETARTTFNALSALVSQKVGEISAETTTMLEGTVANSTYTTMVMFVAGLLSVVFAILCALIISRMITRPLNIMKEYLVRVGLTGDLQFTDSEVDVVRKEAMVKDEVGQSMSAFNDLMARLVYVGDRLTEVANGDLTANIELLSERDTMGKALAFMSDNLNNMFADINSAAQQVNTASGEISNGAQILAQGSTEQAATVQEISASISEITDQADVNLQTAADTANESRKIRDIALDGNEKMDRLSTAVQEMNDASQSIGNVIKVIEDIAFQTNILALNAAVEAARAGAHGKGFAVVAEEVRNLANKSSEAAKETAELISSNIEKSQLGLSISKETAETLRQIVDGVERTTLSLNNIAEQSSASKTATENVNNAVDQVAQVVQQNSATSEESAAASEEMSGQAQILRQLIGQFQLKSALDTGANVKLLASQQMEMSGVEAE